ncbi:4-hydroxy-3-methylbut-2-enyl diphosphate reductase IspH [Oxalobacteraceae bacterium GrIS 1.11]
MEFEERLEALNKSRNTPSYEVDAAVNIYERLVSAQSMCESVFGKDAPAAVVAKVLVELSAEARFILLNDERLLAEGDEDSPA